MQWHKIVISLHTICAVHNISSFVLIELILSITIVVIWTKYYIVKYFIYVFDTVSTSFANTSRTFFQFPYQMFSNSTLVLSSRSGTRVLYFG